MSVRLNVRRFFKIFLFIKSNPIETCFIISLILGILAPLRCPTFRGYPYLNLPEIKDDLQMCLVTRRPHEFKLCPLVSRDPGGHKRFRMQYCIRSIVYKRYVLEMRFQLDTFRHANTNLNVTFLKEMPKKFKLEPGGRWFPKHCASWQRVAVIVPYRNREMQLQIFLQNMHPFLQGQQLDYGIFVIEQSEKHAFNRGKLFNIGFLEASKEPDFCCFIFHDVDILPESPQHTYGCSEEPRHMCSALDTFRYILPYPELFGGVVAFTKEQFSTVNGYSNLYFGWGGEDDDLYERLHAKDLKVTRWAPHLSRYTMLVHKKEIPNPERINLLKTTRQRMDSDGLNTLDYKILKLDLTPLYTHIVVDVKPR